MTAADALWRDVVFAARLLRQSPVVTTTAVLTLALGIGVNIAVFSVVNAFILRPLPVRDGGRLVVLASQGSSSGTLDGMSFTDLQDYRPGTADVFEDIAGYSVGFLGLTPQGGRTERVLVTWVTGNYFSLLGIQPALGRFINAGEGGPGRVDAVAVIGYSTWQRTFAGSRSVIGQTVRINGHPCTIVGVAPSSFVGTFAFSDSALYLPLNWSGAPSDFDNREARGLHTLARLRPDVTLEQAQTAVNVVTERLARQYPDSNRNVAVSIWPERLARPIEDQVRSNARIAAIMLGLVSLVVIVAAVNVTNLLLARATSRRRELVIRTALGARRGRLAQQMMTESLLVAALGGAAGILLGGWAARLLANIPIPGDQPVRFDFQLDWRVLVYAVMTVMVTGLLVGLVPAVRATRVDLNRAFRQLGQGATTAVAHHWIRSLLVVAQVASCFVLLVVAGLFVRSLAQAQRADLGFQPEGVLNLHMSVGELGYTEAQGRAFFDDIRRQVRGLPGVERLSFAATIPMGYVRFTDTLEAEGRPVTASDPLSTRFNVVSTEYFETMGIPIVRGRAFRDADDEHSRPVAIVNQRLAEMLWPGQGPIGRHFRSAGGSGAWVEIVGVAPTGKYGSLFEDPHPYFYVPIAQSYTHDRVLQVRTSMEPEALAPAIERLIRVAEPDLPVYDVQSMTQALGGGYGFFPVRMGAFSAATFGLLGLALAVIGVYGVVSYVASLRTHEIGVRVALGATPHDILRLVVREGLKLVLLGLAAGLFLTLASSRVLETFLFGVSTHDAVTFAGVAMVLGCVALVASAIPAWHAARVDPTVTLRAE